MGCSSAANTAINGGECAVGKTDCFLVTSGMVNANRTGWRRAGPVPPRIVNVETGIGHIVQLDQGEIDTGLRRAEGRAALIFGERSAAVLTAGRRFIVPVNDHACRVGRVQPTM